MPKHSEERYYDPDWKRPEIIYGESLVGEIAKPGERLAVATMEIPWNLVKGKLPVKPEAVVFVQDMELRTLESLEKAVPPVDVVAGIGGGSSHDLAKYIALKKGARLVQVPTILSSDASVTSAIGIREGWRVRYIGHVEIDRILVDFSLIKQAPKELVRYGASDILSSHTAKYDWKIASSRHKERFDQSYYEKARDMLAKLAENRFEVRDVTDEGIKTIVELYLGYAEIAEKLRSDRAQEGSEHFFAYNVEYLTRRQYVHGKLLAVGILAMSYIQENEFDKILQLMRDMGLEARPSIVDLGKEDFSKAMMTLRTFAERGGYYYSVINEIELDRSISEELYKILSSTF
jgi:glycerol-1-phosphate dehydrogenase [NAD(P)+]